MTSKGQKRVDFLFADSEETHYIASAKTIMHDTVLNKLLRKVTDNYEIVMTMSEHTK